MELGKCIAILQDHSCASNDCDCVKIRSNEIKDVVIDDHKSSSINTVDELKTLSNLDILNVLTSLQGERVIAYRDFDSALNLILDHADELRLSEYPLICAEMTATFSTLSSNVILINKELLLRNNNDNNNSNLKLLCKWINQIQEYEKEKLTLTAAKHIDLIQSKYPHFQSQLGVNIDTNNYYTINRMKEIEMKISNIMDDIASEKADYLI